MHNKIPKTGTYEPPHYNHDRTETSSDLWFTVKELSDRMDKSEKLLRRIKEKLKKYFEENDIEIKQKLEKEIKEIIT